MQQSDTKGKESTSLPSLLTYDVVGVDNEDNGRSCESHIACGKYVDVGDVLLCRWNVQQFVGDIPEAVVKVFRINNDGLPGCHIGYLPKRHLKLGDSGKYLNGTVLKVIEDLRLSENRSARSRSHRNYGILYCRNVSDDPHFANKDPFNGDAFDMSAVLEEKQTVHHEEEDVIDDDAAGNDDAMSSDSESN